VTDSVRRAIRGFPTLAVAAAVTLRVSSAGAQPAPPGPQTSTPTTLGFTFEDTFLDDMPLADSVYGVLESVQPSLISDRFTEGGLFASRPARIGGFQASWTQTRFVLGDVDITDPTGSGAPLLVPDLAAWRTLRVATGLLPSDVNATGLEVALHPVKPATNWQHEVTASFAHGALAADPSTLAQPTIARLAGWDRLAWTASGPLGPRLGAGLAVSWTRGSQFDRAETSAVDDRLGSALVTLNYAARRGSVLSTTAWVQGARSPFDYYEAVVPSGSTTASASTDSRASTSAVHVQTTWTSSPSPPTLGTWRWRTSAAYSYRGRSLDLASSMALIDRLRDGPVSPLGTAADNTINRWLVNGRTETIRTTGSTEHHLAIGAEVDDAHQRTPASAIETVGELNDGLPSRIWQFASSAGDSHRRRWVFAAFASDALRLTPKVTVTAGLRFDATSGSAANAAQGVDWQTLLPRARLDWRLHADGPSTVFLGYARSAYQLALDMLAFGDPAAPTANVFRWDSGSPIPPDPRVLVARVGPGTGGSPDFVTLDPNLARPFSDEVVIGLERRQTRSRFQIAAVGRRESDFIGLKNIGVPATAYTTFTVSDPGANTGSPDDDKVITVYDRLPSSLGADRYLLTNTGERAAMSGSLELSGEWTTARLTLYGGATASIATGPAANRGFGPLENDQSALSDAYVTPNDTTFARGRLFNDRAFTIKLSGVYRFPWDVRLGAIARYQDGQPFSRMLVFPGLSQGTEAVRAFAAGDSRFRFIGTLDTRLSKGVQFGQRSLQLFLDAYNLLGLTYDVEERSAAPPDVRTPTAIQPSRAFHVGVRAKF